VELLASLNLVERDDYSLEEVNMLFSKWDSEARNNRSKDV